jgi:uncharacterized protein YlxW (UPF0749 family)
VPVRLRPSDVGVFAVLVVAGLLFVVSATTARGTQLRTDRGDAVGFVRSEQARFAAKLDELARLRREVEERTRAEAGGSAVVSRLKTSADALAPQAGLGPVMGPALTVVLNDAPRRGTLPGSARPDDLVVHQQDVQAVVNALWLGGAEAMMLMDQRVISTSAVRCVGNTLLLQGRVYSPPYRITAIGNVQRMRNALDSSAAVQVYKEFVTVFQLGYEVSDAGDTTFPAFAGSLDLRYAMPLPVPSPSASPGASTPSPGASSPSITGSAPASASATATPTGPASPSRTP